MSFNDKKIYFYLQFDDRITNDVVVLRLKQIPGGKAIVYTYLEMLVLAGTSGGIIYYNKLFPSIGDQIAIQLKGFTAEEINLALSFFCTNGYIVASADGQSYTFTQAPLLTSSQKGGTRRKKLAAVKRKAEATCGEVPESKIGTANNAPPLEAKNTSTMAAKNTTTISGMSPCAVILDKVGAKNAAKQHDVGVFINNEKQQHTQSNDDNQKLAYLMEAGISSSVANRLIGLKHIQKMDMDRLNKIYAYAAKNATSNAEGYFVTLLKNETLQLPSDQAKKAPEKVYDPDCPKCHGTGIQTIIATCDDYEFKDEIPCDCWKKHHF